MYGAGTIADDGDFLPFQDHLVVPVGGVYDVSSEVFDPGNVRHLKMIENATSVDKYVTCQFLDRLAFVDLDLDSPCSTFVIPLSFSHFSVEGDVTLQAKVPTNRVEIALNLS